MRRLFMLLALLVAAPASAQLLGPPQTIAVIDSGTACVTAPTACATFDVSTATSAAFDISGTWTGTLTFEGTANGGAWRTITVINVNGRAPVTTTTASGTFAVPNGGFTQVRARATATITGSAVVTATRGYGVVGQTVPAFPVTFTAGDLLYANTTTTVSGIADAAVGQVLSSGGVGVVPAYTATPTIGTLTLSTPKATAPTDSTTVDPGSVTRLRSSSTITPATAGVGNCGAAFAAAALTADCTIATLPAGMKLVAVYADVTVGLTCSATCSGTKVIRAGITAGGTEILATSLNVAITATYGLADADLGSGMTRAAAIQGGYTPSWSGTTPIIVRFTSGTGNWGSGAATNVNAGSVKFTLVTEQIK